MKALVLEISQMHLASWALALNCQRGASLCGQRQLRGGLAGDGWLDGFN